MLSRTVVPVIIAAAVLGTSAAPAASDALNSITRSQNTDDSYRLVLTQIGDSGEETPMKEMIVSFPATPGENSNTKRGKPSNGCVVM